MKLKGKLIKKKDIEFGIFDCSEDSLYENFEYSLLISKLSSQLNLRIDFQKTNKIDIFKLNTPK